MNYETVSYRGEGPLTEKTDRFGPMIVAPNTSQIGEGGHCGVLLNHVTHAEAHTIHQALLRGIVYKASKNNKSMTITIK